MPTPTPPNNSLKHLQLTINTPIINPDKFADKFRVSSPRMTNWDYSSPGFYFITICTLNMNNFFGKITGGEMELSKIGKIASTELSKTIQIRKNTINIPTSIIMPNHLHLIIEIKHVSRDVARYVSTNTTRVSTNNFVKNNPMSTISPKSNSIASIIRSYKSAIKLQCNQIPIFFAWQSRFYDHLIHSCQEYFQIKNYVLSNPANWSKDKYNL